MSKIKKYALHLVCPSDDILVRVFDSATDVCQFIGDNPPRPVQGPEAEPSGPLYDAYAVRGIDNGSHNVLGYVVTVLEDGVPVHVVRCCWDGEPFDPKLPLFPVEDSAA